MTLKFVNLQVSVADVADSVKLCSSELSISRATPLPQWTETHPALICQTTCELLFAVSVAISDDHQYAGWSTLVCLEELTGVGESNGQQSHGNLDQTNRVRHVSVPSARAG